MKDKRHSAGMIAAVAGILAYKATYKKGICVEDSLNTGKSLTKNGIPVAFLV